MSIHTVATYTLLHRARSTFSLSLSFSLSLFLFSYFLPVDKTTGSPPPPLGSFIRCFTKRSRFKQCPGYSRTLLFHGTPSHTHANTYSTGLPPEPLSTFSYQAAVPRRRFSLLSSTPPPSVVTRDRLAGVRFFLGPSRTVRTRRAYKIGGGFPELVRVAACNNHTVSIKTCLAPRSRKGKNGKVAQQCSHYSPFVRNDVA